MAGPAATSALAGVDATAYVLHLDTMVDGPAHGTRYDTNTLWDVEAEGFIEAIGLLRSALVALASMSSV
jgi:hypothetical protein